MARLHVLLLVGQSVCAAMSSCATATANAACGEEVSSLLQSKVSMQDAVTSESVMETGTEVGGLQFSQEAINERSRTRTRLIIESDLGSFDAVHYRAFQPDNDLLTNSREAFTHFLKTSNLGDELTSAETELFRERFEEKLSIYLKHDDFSADKDHSVWLNDVAKALNREKPVYTEALEKSVNDAKLGFESELQPWMKNMSWSDYEDKHGLKSEQNGSSFVQSSEGDVAQFDSLLDIDTPPTMEGDAKWPECAQVIERIHNQGRCGSCWAFGALSALDSRLCIKSNGVFSGNAAMLSRGYITSCAYTRDGCQGGLMSQAYSVYKRSATAGVTGGVTGCSPYFGHGEGTEHFASRDPSPPCPTRCAPSYTQRSMANDRYHFADMSWQTRGRSPSMMQAMKATLYNDGPVSYAMLADQPFMGYRSGVYANGCKPSANHAVTAIGYGTTYITSLNSWGPGWGDGGRFKIQLCNIHFVTLFGFNVNTNTLPNPLVPGGSTGPTTPPTNPPTVAPGDQPWSIREGLCRIDQNGCATSPNYPSKYGSNQRCVVSIRGSSPAIEVVDFAVERGWDKMTVDGVDYDDGASLHGKVPRSVMNWQSDGSVEQTGWKICPRAGSSPTPAPTTPAPTTRAPTTRAPNTPSPTTPSPTTPSPTTPAPTTLAPTTPAPTTLAPTTLAPTTPAPDSVVVTRETLARALETNIDDEFITKVMNSLR